MAKTSRQEKAAAFKEDLMKELSDKVSELVQEDRWKAFLDFGSRFRSYSFSNVMLIMMQKPEATYVSSYKNWNTMNRSPKKGTAIYIRGFSTKKYTVENEKGEEEEKKRVTFPIVKVFDVSDTYIVDPKKGDPVNEVEDSIVTKLQGEGDQAVFDRLTEFITDKDWTWEFGDCGHANGFTNHNSKLIRISDGLSDAQKLKTLVHEIGHMILHGENADGDLHRGVKEVEAESTAYVVCKTLGMDTSDYTIGYLASWTGGDTELITSAGTRVMKARKDILDWLNKDYSE